MASLAPEVWSLGKIRWQAFVTLTFRGEPPGCARANRNVRTWLIGVARFARVPYNSVLWVVRPELGEKTGRYHFHVLIAGLPQHVVNITFLKRIAYRWQFGFSDVRLWLDGLDAESYVCKAGANTYELGKVGRSTQPILSESLLDMVSTGDRVERRHVKPSDNPGPLRGRAELLPGHPSR
jgi:hypothetical protein